MNLLVKGAPQPTPSVAAPNPSDRLKYGEYLVAIGGCIGCHTPEEKGGLVAGKEYGGGSKFEAPAYGTVYSANITPDLETGIGKWSEEFFVKKFYDYREYAEHGPPKTTGPEQFTVMPWLAFSSLTREDLGAIYTYLRTIKPLHNAVETHPKKQTTAPSRQCRIVFPISAILGGRWTPRKTALGFICVHLRVSAAGFGFKRPLQTQNGRRWTQMHADNAAHFDSAPERFDCGKVATSGF